MDVELEIKENFITKKDLAVVFRYSRSNIYSYHALIGSLEIHSYLSQVPIYIPTPETFQDEIDRLINIESFSKVIVGLSLHTFQLVETIQEIKKLNSHPKRSNIIIIAGGPHPSAKPSDLLNVGADIVVIGEGEKTFPEVLMAIINNQHYSELAGIAYKENNKITVQPENNTICLNDYPPFAPKHELYSALEITRGCKYNCKYCQTPRLFGRNVRFRKPENVIKWGKFLLKKRANWDFRFITPNAFGYGSKKASEPNLEMIEELLSGLDSLQADKRKRIFFGTFPSEIRPESVTDGTLSLTKKYCDNNNLTIGAQTGSPKIMKEIQRGHTIEKVIDAVDLAISYGFKLNVDFIIGFPEETTEDQELTLQLCKEFIKKGCKIHMHYLIPLPGTAYENVEPSKIDDDILQILREWSNTGKIFGSWQHQYDLIVRNIKRIN